MGCATSSDTKLRNMCYGDLPDEGTRLDAINALIESGADPNEFGTGGESYLKDNYNALQWTAQGGLDIQREDIMKELVNKHGVDVNSQNPDGKRTALMISARKGDDVEGVKLLLSLKADVNLTDANGETALKHACFAAYGDRIPKQMPVIQALIEAKADVNKDLSTSLASSEWSTTPSPLWDCAKNGNRAAFKLLVDAGADTTVPWEDKNLNEMLEAAEKEREAEQAKETARNLQALQQDLNEQQAKGMQQAMQQARQHGYA